MTVPLPWPGYGALFTIDIDDCGGVIWLNYQVNVPLAMSTRLKSILKDELTIRYNNLNFVGFLKFVQLFELQSQIASRGNNTCDIACTLQHFL